MLVLRPGALGDTLLAVPALRALRSQFGCLSLAAHDRAAMLLQQAGEIARGVAFDDPSLTWIFGAESPGCQTPVVAWLSGPRPPGLDDALLVVSGRPPGEDVHCARHLLDTLAPLGITDELDDRPLSIAPIGASAREILVHPGSGSPGKNWPAERFAAIIRGLDAPVRLIVGEADAEPALRVEQAVGRPLPRLEQAPLAEVAGRLAGCRAYLGNDSGISHLAGLSGARTVALFGPTSPRVWAPLGPDVHVRSFEADPLELARLLTPA